MVVAQPVPEAPPPRPAKGLALGWVVDDPGHKLLLTDADVQLLRGLGVETVRFEVRLGQKAAWDAQLLDLYGTAIQMLGDAGIQPLVLLGNDIVGQSGQAEWNADAREITGASPANNPFIDQFVENATQIVTRLANVPLWEIWNEPNAWTKQLAQNEYSGGTFIYPSLYATVLLQTYEALSAIPGDRTLLTGGLLGHNLHGQLTAASTGAAYLNQVFAELNGVGGPTWPFDAIGQHYYLDPGGMVDPAHITQALALLDAVVTDNGVPAERRGVYITEVGWQTPPLSEAAQAENLGHFYATCSASPMLRAICWFLLRDNPAAKLNYGLRTGDDRPKQAFTSFQRAPDEVIYTVKPGDTLSAIGDHFGVAWNTIYDANRAVIGPDPNVIQPGERLVIPMP